LIAIRFTSSCAGADFVPSPPPVFGAQPRPHPHDETMRAKRARRLSVVIELWNPVARSELFALGRSSPFP